jgi:hypothetical protein
MPDDAIVLPEALHGIFFPFRWDKLALWALPTTVSVVALAELDWHLDLPVWSTQPPQPLFNLRPREVLACPNHHLDHWDRILAADTIYPLDLFHYNGRWVIMDGYHRLAKHAAFDMKWVNIRKHPDELFVEIQLN